MHFGLFAWFTPIDGKPYSEAFEATFEQICRAERAGWDSVWMPETHFGGDLILSSSPFVLSSAIAARTSRIKIGSAVHQPRLLLPAGSAVASDSSEPDTATMPRSVSNYSMLAPADPIRTAEDTAMVDQVSGGRFIYGVGGGSRGNKDKRKKFFEFLDVVRRAWADEDEFSGYSGTYYKYEPMLAVRPTPSQRPGPPIMVAAESDTSFPALGSMGYHVLIGAGTSHNQHGHSGMTSDIGAYRRAWNEAGHEGTPEIFVRIPTHVADTSEQVQADVAHTIEVARTTYAAAGRQLLPQPDPGTASLERLERGNLFGTPGEVIDRIYKLQEDLGATGVLLETNWFGGVAPEAVNRSMELIAEKVMPTFNR
jgi:alkanesulfonate monooxygenase SsuD/methylene tetrahydromethanopterin reductase-like flavin-dependent oxidoreductase (luciferase family)